MPRHIRDLRPVIGLETSEGGSDSELSTQSARVIPINEARGDLLEVNTVHEKMIFLQTNHLIRKWYYRGGALDARDPPGLSFV